MNNKDIVLAFWEAMNSNDFTRASEWLSPNFSCFWPQSGELIVGRENFIAINTHYPADGDWRFTIHSMMSDEDRVVTDVSITDGIQKDRAITFHTVANGLICKQTEFWPDPMPAPEWRSDWVTIVQEHDE